LFGSFPYLVDVVRTTTVEYPDVLPLKKADDVDTFAQFAASKGRGEELIGAFSQLIDNN
jgi:hypothetical protein